ncbi:MAG: succinyldiaminopimelate transaminase [Betaproteobacteria bacterium RIFCSPLOWO2_02_67_12]|nr:MAG: succinyldiaminopimelate transaminase [Betaproteobacteria bacterium RIFCSPLOWO2_02_67_12]OGA29792.1 MAG: succinyldiaminopimelate transaminase [Betaproteobacteria bacterium RIFCSPLOWO2_02_FULL_68_150]OGA58107.1 MAG: succinyldiaminopimelate transaminase [Betaproteobacteria bacterium RIFCSPLOWO2_12_FULL_67_28]
MNPRLGKLQPYPFEKLRALLSGVTPDPALAPIDLSIGEPKHPTPEFVRAALIRSLDGLAVYPPTAGLPALREAIAAWLMRRYRLPGIDPHTQVLPVNGSREALFSFAQAVIDPAGGGALVACPNPFYQIYEGAALLAGASPVFLNATAANGHRMDLDALPDTTWRAVQLVYTCSPANPGGSVLRLSDWQRLFDLSERHGFAIAADECYSELYCDEANPPLGALEAAQQLGRAGFPRLAVFSSLSKRSNVPGMRSGFVAGDAALLERFLLYRTYHGSAMSLAVQQASIAAWSDETHVRANRQLYAGKYRAVLPLLGAPLETYLPEGGFYLWLRTPVDDCEFVRRLQRDYNVRALPGSYLARTAHGENPGENFVRLALVAPLAECLEAAGRIAQLGSRL